MEKELETYIMLCTAGNVAANRTTLPSQATAFLLLCAQELSTAGGGEGGGLVPDPTPERV
jgi:hypothetical protein